MANIMKLVILNDFLTQLMGTRVLPPFTTLNGLLSR